MKTKRCILTLLAVCLVMAVSAQSDMNKFVDQLLQKMTLEEKLGQLNLAPASDEIVTGGNVDTEVGARIASGQLGGVFNLKGVDKIKALQDIAVKKSRLGIPLIVGMDVIHGYETIFPIPLALSCSWDLAAIENMARVSAREATADGINWVYSPMVDISLDARWGRVAESGGEDPFLGSQIAQAYVRGYQGDQYDTDRVMACVKHYGLYGAVEGGRDSNTVDMSHLRMYNQYFPPYKAAAEAGAGSFMSSFNLVDGQHATANRWLLTDVLRNQWNFNGFVVTDYASYSSTTDMKNSRTSFNGSLDYQRFFNKEHTQSLALTYQLNYSPATTDMTNNFGTTSDYIDLTDRNSENHDKTLNHTFQLDYTMPLGVGQTLSLGGKLQLHNASSDSKYYLKGIYDPTSSSDYEYKNSILAGYGEYAGNWNKFGLKAGLRYEYTWQDVEYHLGNGEDFKKNYGSLVPTASLQYTLGMGSNIGLTYNMRISRPGISYLNPYVDKTNPIAISYGNPELDVEKNHNISLVYNAFTSKLMVNLNLHHNFVDNAISQYSFYDSDNLLNTTYGNVVQRHQTGLSGYVNYLLTKDTRIFFNGSLNYLDLRSDVLDQQNSGWTASAMIGLQQTLPWDLKLSAFAITSTKSYTLQGWSGGFNLLTASVSKSLLNDKLTLGIQGILGLNGGGKINIESESRGKNFTSHNLVKVPIYGVTFTVSYTFGNNKIRAKQHTNRVQNDFIEQQSQGEVINSVGSGSTGSGTTNGTMPQ